MPQKLTYEFVKEQFEMENYKLLSGEYVNNSKKLNYICSGGHRHSITWGNWKSGKRCPYCIGQGKPTIEFIQSQFENVNYRLLTDVYTNAQQKLYYMCSNNHRHSVSWNNWHSKNTRCPTCYNAMRGSSLRLSIEFVKAKFANEGYKLLTDVYINANHKLDYICPNGHKHSITWGHWYSGKRCPVCANNIKKTIEFVKAELHKEGWVLLTDRYENNKQKLKYVCSEGHEGSLAWSDWNTGIRCSVCKALNMSGSNNWNWKGGISCEPYCDAWADKEFKENIKARDNYECQNPDCWATSKRLNIHHVDYIKKHCEPWNLITLCGSCNSRANYSREWHTEFYRKILSEKQGYKYERSLKSNI